MTNNSSTSALIVRSAVILATSVLLTLPIVALARAPYTPAGAGDAVLRFSWRMTTSVRENCRTRTQEELDALPVHMRAPEECTRDASHYQLVLHVGEQTETLPLVKGGAKGDRPLFVLEERRLRPGVYDVSVELQRLADPAETLARLDTALVLRRGAVQLITRGEDGRLLVVGSP
jgi:hypothetical protein